MWKGPEISISRGKIPQSSWQLPNDTKKTPLGRLEWNRFQTSLVAQWLRICLLMQGTWVRALVREDPTCHGATKPMCHNYWACALEPASHNYWAHVLQLLKPVSLESELRNKRSYCNEKPAHHNEEKPSLTTTRESPRAATKTQQQRPNAAKNK